MNYCSVKETAERWEVSGQLVRRLCKEGRIPGAIQRDTGWVIPEDTERPGAPPKVPAPEPTSLLKRVLYQKERNNHFDVYEHIQVNLAYSSCRMASNRLTRQQVEEVYRTDKISVAFEPMKIDDLIEIVNHFRCVSYMLDNVSKPLSQTMIRKLHYLLSYGTYAARDTKTEPGEYRKTSAKIGVHPAQIQSALDSAMRAYEKAEPSLDGILEFHVRLECIRPFEDYNGRVGRVIMMKECLRRGVDPFVIDDKRRGEYNRGIAEWDTDRETLRIVAQQSQARFRKQDEMFLILRRNQAKERRRRKKK